LRFEFPSINQVIFRYLKPIVKEEEKKRILGTTYFIFAALLVVWLFKKPIAITSISFAVFGDAAATLVGVKWGRIKLGQRSLEGSIAFFLICLIVGLGLLRVLMLNLNIVLIGALAAALIELLPLPFDDNLTVPIFSALVMSLI
jgi:dolichol kinase